MSFTFTSLTRAKYDSEAEKILLVLNKQEYQRQFWIYIAVSMHDQNTNIEPIMF